MTERYMRAYYFAFSPTGCDPVDAILEAVAIAGKAYHHTDEWGSHDGDRPSYAELIQSAADEAARKFESSARVVDIPPGGSSEPRKCADCGGIVRQRPHGITVIDYPEGSRPAPDAAPKMARLERTGEGLRA